MGRLHIKDQPNKTENRLEINMSLGKLYKCSRFRRVWCAQHVCVAATHEVAKHLLRLGVNDRVDKAVI